MEQEREAAQKEMEMLERMKEEQLMIQQKLEEEIQVGQRKQTKRNGKRNLCAPPCSLFCMEESLVSRTELGRNKQKLVLA